MRKVIRTLSLSMIIAFTISIPTFGEEILEDSTHSDGTYLIEKDMYDENGMFLSRYEYVYDENYQLTNENYESDTEFVPNINEYEYDSNGNIIKRVHSPKGSSITVSEFTYDEDNIMIESSYEEDGETLNSTTYVYDEEGRLSERIVHVIDGNYDDVITYDYDDKGQNIRQYSDDGSYVVNYTYDNDGNLIEQMSQEGTGSVWTYENGLRVEQKYYFHGELMTVTKYIYEYTDSYQEGTANNSEENLDELDEKNTIEMVQEALNNAGYDCGTADGVAGSRTQDAIRQYQEDNGMSVNGEINNELLESLNINIITDETKIPETDTTADEGTEYSALMGYYLGYVTGNTSTWSYIGPNNQIPEPDSCLKNISSKTNESNAYYYILSDQNEESLDEMAAAYALILTLDCDLTLDSVEGMSDSIEGIYSNGSWIGLFVKGTDPDLGYYLGVAVVE